MKLNERQWQALRALKAADCGPYSHGWDLLRLVFILKTDALPDLKFGSTMCALERRGLVERAYEWRTAEEIREAFRRAIESPERIPENWRLTEKGVAFIDEGDRFRPLVRTRPTALSGPSHASARSASVRS